MTAEPDLQNRILGHLADHRDQTTLDIARDLEADYWDVQQAVCRLLLIESVVQTGQRQVEDGRVRPTYAAAPLTIPWHLIRRSQDAK